MSRDRRGVVCADEIRGGPRKRRRSRGVGRVIYQRPYPEHVKRRGYPVTLVVGRR